MTARILTLLALVFILVLAGCQPEDRRPGQWIGGEAKPYPEDWGFADAFQEIALEVNTPYFIPHSVTIWCATLNGTLYIAASRPEEKRWPGWVDDDPRVRLRIGDAVYEAQLVPLADEALIRQVVAVQSAKYGFDMPSGPTGARYWRVAPRGA